jgi:hypothetical protein
MLQLLPVEKPFFCKKLLKIGCELVSDIAGNAEAGRESFKHHCIVQ